METMQLPGGTDVELTQNTLLLVDDEENILSSLRRLLRKDGYRILSATSGEAGLAILDEEKVDVIISDQRMPHMIGTTFLRKARDRSPHSVRMILSGYTDLDSVTDAINEGAVYKFLTKPWDDEMLRIAVREALQYKWVGDENRMLQGMLLDRNDELARACASLVDQADASRNALRSLQHLLDALPLPLISLDATGHPRFLNPAASHCRSLSPDADWAGLLAATAACRRNTLDVGTQRLTALSQPNAGEPGGHVIVLIPDAQS
ncbi:response regulator [Uliginosibacterium paludis]|uniref:Response regulator n=1 Tax=Uliginosibacterium paludis TaxID=1615952 RepID=A0ABV2CN44_9RHOO